jgi:hypothetical protein
MKVPRDVSGTHLTNVLCRRWQYAKVHQVGSHIILRPRNRLTNGSQFRSTTLFGSERSFRFFELSPSTKV